MLDYDVIIAGAGPAGNAAAIVAARRGLRVLLIEKSAFPRTKVCGEGMLPGAVRILEELGLEMRLCEAGAVPFGEIRFRFAGVREEPFRLSMGRGTSGWLGRGFACQRARLDTALAVAAADSGAEVRFGWEVTDARTELGAVTIGCRVGRVVTGELRSRFAILAGGAASGIHGGHDRLPGNGRFGLACHISDDPDSPSGVDVYVGSGHEVYSALTATGERVLSVLCDRGEARASRGGARARLLALLDSVNVPAVWRDEVRSASSNIFAGGGFGSRARVLAFGRIFLAGDAAYISDPVAAQGIYCALATGRMAGLVVADAIENEHSPARAAARYAREVEPILNRSHLVAVGLYGLLRKPWLRRRAFPLLRGALLDQCLGIRPPPSFFRLAGGKARSREEQRCAGRGIVFEES